jgi:hypothetical protein
VTGQPSRWDWTSRWRGDRARRPLTDCRARFGVSRAKPAACGPQTTQTMQMLEAPFYSRCLVETVLDGEVVTGVHGR